MELFGALGSRPEWSHVPQLFVLVCLVVFVLKLTTLIVQGRRAQRGLAHFPGPSGHWLMGNVLQLKQDGTSQDEMVKMARQYPYAFPLWFGPFVPVLNLHHPAYVKTLLGSTEPKSSLGYRFITPWIGEGLLVLSGEKWFRHRRLLTPGFHYDVLKPYVKLMADSTHVMLDKWEDFAKTQESFELFNPVSLMTLDSIMKCAFSCNSHCQTHGDTNKYIRAVYDLSDLAVARTRNFLYHSDIIFHLCPVGFRFRKACKVAHDHTDEVIRKRREALKAEEELGSKQTKRYMDFLDILLRAKDDRQQGLSDEDLRAEVDTFMFEGHDTTASGVSFILYCLACHPEHQKLCREEIVQVLDGKESIEWEDLNKIPYTTMCIKECLRLFPPVPGISRTLSKPMTFFDGRTVPEGTHVGISIYATHRNETVWENPDMFDPLRFLPENVSRRSPHAFVPFAAGPRNCIGQNFAMNEMKVVIALTLRRYVLMEDPTMKPKIIPKLVLRSLNGIHIKIKPVEPNL